VDEVWRRKRGEMMDKVTLVFIFIMALCIIGLMFCFYMLARNEAIHEAR
jgi:F0F1-type ATP synthase membrane subunit c/vacuolar-type H+-ATPase subunit K